VPVVTFDTLCERHGCGKVHLLLLDTEGYDWEILKSIDLEKHRPRLVIYEHYHLSAVERAESRRHLELFGYRTLQEGFDTLCLDVSEDDALTRRFGRLSPAVGAVSADEDRS
jgi:hypothetical protein